jgi:hypothetical protein
MWLESKTVQHQGGTAAVLRLVIFAGVLLSVLPGPDSVSASPSGLSDAIRAQRLRLETTPRDVSALNDLGNLLVLAGDVEEAEEVYRRALEIEPDRVPTIYNLALLQAEAGQRRLASRGFRKVLEIDPGHAWSHYQLGVLTAATDNRNKAIGHYARAFRLEPRLAIPEFNAHAIDNDLLLDALLHASPANSPANTVPKIYDDPSRVRALLLPSAVPAAESADRGESASRPGGGIGPSGGGLGAEADEPGRVEPESKSSASHSEASTQGGERRRAEPNIQTIRQPVASPVPAEAPAGSAEAPVAREVAPPQPAAQPVAPKATQPPDPPSSTPAASEPEPVFGSTAQLELRLVPKPQDRLASLASAPR